LHLIKQPCCHKLSLHINPSEDEKTHIIYFSDHDTDNWFKSTDHGFRFNGADGNYTSLTNFKGAFSKINGSSQAGYSIVIKITGNSTSESGFYALNDKGWNS